MKKSRYAAGLFLLMIVIVLIMSSINCGTNERQPITSKQYVGFVYAPVDASVRENGIGLTILQSSNAPEGYKAVEGAVIYPESNPENKVYSNEFGRFVIFFDFFNQDTPGNRSINNDVINVIVEPSQELSSLPPIRYIIAPPAEADDHFENITLYPNARNIKVGQVIQLQVLGIMKDGQTRHIKPELISWPGNINTGKIYSTGLFTGLQAGTDLFTVTYNSLSFTGKIYVREQDDESYTLSGVVTDENGNFISDAIITLDGMDSVGRTNSTGSYSIFNVPGNIQLTLMAKVNGRALYTTLLTLTGNTVHNIVINSTPLPNGTLRGVVTSAETGQPVKGVLVTIGDWNTNTDINGAYLIEDISSGIYNVTFDKAGYVSKTVTQKITADSIVVLDILLNETPGVIKGRVVNEADQGIEGAEVTCADTTITTDSDGYFTFTQVPPGSYTLTVSREWYFDTQEDVTVLTGKEVNVNIKLILLPGNNLVAGYITRSLGGAPVPGSTVTASGIVNTSTKTLADGSYSFILPDGTYDITARKEGFAESRIENIALTDDVTFVNANLIQFPAFNPDWEVKSPDIEITGISDEEIINGQTFDVRVSVSGANPTRFITARIGNRTSTPDYKISDKDILEFSWNSASYMPPPSNSYLYIVAYDVNFNRTEKIIRLLTSEDIGAELSSPTNTFAFSYTYYQDLEIMAKKQQEEFKRTGVRYESNHLQLPGGRSVDLRAVPSDTTIFVIIEWDQVPGADGYRIYRSASGNSCRYIGSTMMGAYTVFYDYSPDLTPGVMYTYQVKPYNLNGTGNEATTPPVTVLDQFIVALESPANGATNVPTKPTFTWNVINNTGEYQYYRVSVIGLNDSGYAWLSGTVWNTTSVLSAVTLAKNKAYEWDLLYCYALGDWNNDAWDYLAYSVASPAGSSTTGTHIFTTTSSTTP
jgi:hypothetical protein